MKRRTLKRQLQSEPADAEMAGLESLASRARYGGNPHHKRNPGDFGLTPPSQPRVAATLCDGASIFTRASAAALLREGIWRGLISVQKHNGWPQNVWAVTPDGIPLEAQLENQEVGSYHGYPMAASEPLRDHVIERWNLSRQTRGDYDGV
ncbi:MAG TPA: hypothetical protein VFJ58_19565 [Armatimonadota bacterium]|nr:hypothetical protein [Armatimonadota bacterium]